jgi:hypothetical protein
MLALRLDAVVLESGDDISEQFEEQMGRGCVQKLIFELWVAVIAITELISCTASSVPWRFVRHNNDHESRDVI